MPDIHARLSASGAKKWLNCPGSVQLEEQFRDKPSEFASEGTAAHTLAEAKIKLAANKINRTRYAAMIEKLEITGDMDEYTDGYRDFVLERYNEALRTIPDAKLLIEQRLDFSTWVPGGFGTGDAVIVGNGVMEIIDLKYGRGVKVSAENNPQLRLYALGALDEYDYIYGIEVVRTTIYQPRIDNINSEDLTSEELYKWGELVSDSAKKAADDSITNCVAGCHCDDGFCKARPACRAYAAKRQEMAKFDFMPPAKLTPDEIAKIIDEADKLQIWAKIVSDYALDQALNHGVSYPGFKLVEGRSNRKYIDEVKVGKQLIENGYTESDIYIRKLKGITDMEKLLGKKSFNDVLGELVVKPQGKPTLVHIEDKRPALNSAVQATEDFKEIIEN